MPRAEAPAEAPDGPKPPTTPLGEWTKLTDQALTDMLNSRVRTDGWTVGNAPNIPVLITIDGRYLRGTEPRFPQADFPHRSVYGLFPEYGGWWMLQDHVEISANPSGSIGYKVPVLVQMFFPREDSGPDRKIPLKRLPPHLRHLQLFQNPQEMQENKQLDEGYHQQQKLMTDKQNLRSLRSQELKKQLSDRTGHHSILAGA
jgi:hypothetical protein